MQCSRKKIIVPHVRTPKLPCKNLSSPAYCTRFHTAVNLSLDNCFVQVSVQWYKNPRVLKCQSAKMVLLEVCPILQRVSSSICTVCTGAGKLTKSALARNREEREREWDEIIFSCLYCPCPFSWRRKRRRQKRGWVGVETGRRREMEAWLQTFLFRGPTPNGGGETYHGK